MKTIYMQQGDVILYKEQSIPKNATSVKVTGNSFVLEKGEGIHTHRLKPMKQQLMQVFETKERYYINTGQGLILEHEEHGTADLEPELILSKVKEREFDYETMEARNVMD